MPMEHRFQWLQDKDIGAMTAGWNYLVGEDGPTAAHLYHYTMGLPGIEHYADDHGSWKWHKQFLRAMECAGEAPADMVERAEERIGSVTEVA